MNQKNKNNNENKENRGQSSDGILGGCAVIAGAALYLFEITFDSVFDYIFTPILAIFVVFIFFGIGFAIMNTLVPEMVKFPKWLRNTCIFLMIIGLVLAQYYLLGMLF